MLHKNPLAGIQILAKQSYELVPIGSVQPHPRNVNQGDLELLIASIKAIGFSGVLLVQRSTGFIIAGNHSWRAAQAVGMERVPVLYVDIDDETALRRMLADNQITRKGVDDQDALAALLSELQGSGSLEGTGFDTRDLEMLLDDLGQFGANQDVDPDAVPETEELPVTERGDLWELGPHRVLCGDCTNPQDVERLLDGRKPLLLVTDPPYGIELDTEWRDRAGLNGHGAAEPSYMKHRTEGHTNTTVSSDTRADWSEAFALVPSIEVAYVWHASTFTREVLNGLERIGFLYPQQIIWNKGRVVLTRTHYWYQHEPCWYVRKKNAPWYGEAGKNATVWDSASPKFIMGGSDEQKFDHPTQKPVELMRRSILNHLHRGELVYEPFLGSGTTLAAAELTQRVCVGMELEPKYCDVVIQRWQGLSGLQAVLVSTGQTFEQVKQQRTTVAA